MKKTKIKFKSFTEHHIIYGLPEHMKRQNDLTCFLSNGAHAVITDVMYSVAQDDRMFGWCLIFEGLKRIMKSDIQKFNKERGLTCKHTSKNTKK